MAETSSKPYLLRALYEWCTDNGFTPYIAVYVDSRTSVPREHVKDGEIVLNIGFDATSKLDLGNDWVDFYGRFSGVSRKIEVPVDNILSIYARENGQGMAFPVDRAEIDAKGALAPAHVLEEAQSPAADERHVEGQAPQPSRPRPSLKVIK